MRIILPKELEEKVDRLVNYFDKDKIEEIAKETGFVKRKSKLSGVLFLSIFLLGLELHKKPSLSELIGLLNILLPESKISREGFHQRINAKAVCFFEKMLSRLMEIPTDISLELAKSFKRIIILDSTIIKLPKELSDIFKGSGGKGSKASLKIQFFYDLKSGKFTYQLQQGVSPDNSYDNNFVCHISKTDLIIKDLGYFNSKVFIDISEKEGFFLSRWKSDTKLYNEQGKEIDLISLVSKVEQIEENEVFIKHDEKLVGARLVVEKAPDHVKEKRLRVINAYNKRKGFNTQEKTKILQGYNIFISNIPTLVLSKENFRTFYMIRWQIELVFKNWKSNFNLDKISGFRKDRILCLFYARFILIFISIKFIFIIRNYLWEEKSRELSDTKALKHFKQVLSECFKEIIVNNIIKIKTLFFSSIEFIQKNCLKIKQRERTYPLVILSIIDLP